MTSPGQLARKHYRIAAVEVANCLTRYREAYLAWDREVLALCAKHGANGRVLSGFGGGWNLDVTALLFPKGVTPPRSVRECKVNPGWYLPNLRSVHGRELQEALRNINQQKPLPSQLFALAGLQEEYWVGGVITSPTFFQDAQGALCLGLHPQVQYQPPFPVEELTEQAFDGLYQHVHLQDQASTVG